MAEEEFEEEDSSDEEIKKISVDENGYEIDDMYTDVLRGYAIYDENEADNISLNRSEDEILKIQFACQTYNYKGGTIASKSFKPMKYSRYSNLEYSNT